MSLEQRFSRREIIELTVAGGLAVGLPSPTYAGMREQRKDRRRAPKNVIFMVSDGMSMGVISLADSFGRLTRGTGTLWAQLLREPSAVHGVAETHSLSSLVTDSAAATTAWGSGSRVFNGAINVLPDGRPLVPIGKLVKDAGRRCGLVTTTRITHATPAGFAAVQARRDDEHLIAPQYLEVVDVLMGGGRKHFDAALRKDGRDLIGEFVGRGYTFWEQRQQVTGSARPPKVLGLFCDEHMPYTIDHRNRAELEQAVPTLAEMTRAALEILSADGPGFLLQVEGGRVDHAAHANDAAALLWDQLAFDEALGEAIKFAQRDPDTLVIVTTDHGNANPGLNGMGAEYGESTECFTRLAKATVSFERFNADLRKSGPPASAEQMQALVRQSFGLDIDSAEAETLVAAVSGNLPAELNRQHRNLVGALGQVLGNHNGIGWTGVTHTQDWVLCSAVGPGAEDFQGLLRNCDVFGRLTSLFNIAHTNPQMEPSEAHALLARAPHVLEAHWV